MKTIVVILALLASNVVVNAQAKTGKDVTYAPGQYVVTSNFPVTYLQSVPVAMAVNGKPITAFYSKAKLDTGNVTTFKPSTFWIFENQPLAALTGSAKTSNMPVVRLPNTSGNMPILKTDPKKHNMPVVGSYNEIQTGPDPNRVDITPATKKP